MSVLVEKLFAIHDSLTAAGFAHAFGGAIALAYCVEEPRGTRDLDINIFTPASKARTALAALPEPIRVKPHDIEATERDGQRRLWWGDTPIDVFLSNHPVHDQAAASIVWVPLRDREIPAIDCATLVVFKALFDRPRDWADIHEVAARAPGHLDRAVAMLAELIGTDDPIYARLTSVRSAR
jgi:hypothetical protein